MKKSKIIILTFIAYLSLTAAFLYLSEFVEENDKLLGLVFLIFLLYSFFNIIALLILAYKFIFLRDTVKQQVVNGEINMINQNKNDNENAGINKKKVSVWKGCLIFGIVGCLFFVMWFIVMMAAWSGYFDNINKLFMDGEFNIDNNEKIQIVTVIEKEILDYSDMFKLMGSHLAYVSTNKLVVYDLDNDEKEFFGKAVVDADSSPSTAMYFNQEGSIKFSQSGRYLIYIDENKGLLMHDFRKNSNIVLSQKYVHSFGNKNESLTINIGNVLFSPSENKIMYPDNTSIKIYDIEKNIYKVVQMFSCENKELGDCVASIQNMRIDWEGEERINFLNGAMNCEYDILSSQTKCENDGIDSNNSQVVETMKRDNIKDDIKEYNKKNQDEKIKKIISAKYGEGPCMVPYEENANKKVVVCKSDRIIGGDNGDYWYNNIIYFDNNKPILIYRTQDDFINYFWYRDNFYFMVRLNKEEGSVFELKKVVFK
jgi:hypothetical protein